MCSSFGLARGGGKRAILPSDEVVIGYCGRFDEDKGVLDLIEAVRRCRTMGKRNLTLKLLGAGDLGSLLNDLSRRTPWLDVRSAVPNHMVPDFLNELDIFAFPSRKSIVHEEHDAHALIEALAVGLPSIGTTSGVIPEVLHNNTGILVPPEDPEALAVKLTELADNPVLRTRLSEVGRKKAVGLFSIEAIAKEKSRIYQEVFSWRKTV